jgi:hypothetical protein
MRLPAFVIAVLTSLLVCGSAASAETADVLIQAGHQGRPASCTPLHVAKCNLGAGRGTALERDWNPRVADAAAAQLRRDGFSVIRRPADYLAHDRARVAIFVHFDGAEPACASGASVGFPPTTSRAFVTGWESLYRRLYPFRFVGENFTKGERQYYDYRRVDAPQKMLIEFGEITCPAQRDWLAPRLHLIGERLAQYVEGTLRM